MKFPHFLFLILVLGEGHLPAAGPLMRLMERRAPFPPVQHLHDVTYADGRFIATGNHNTLLTSMEGERWEAIELENPFHWHAAIHTGTEWQVFGDTLMASSPDGTSWSLREARHYDSLIVLPDGTYASARSNSPYLSDDGLHWTSVRPTELNSLRARGIASNGERLVIVGNEGMILSSDDRGETWTPRVEGMIEGFTGRREEFLGIRYVNEAFFAFGQSGLLMTSASGIDWTLVPAPKPNTITDVVHFQGKYYVSMIFSSAVAVTSDLQTWEFPLVRASTIEAMAAGDESLVAVSEEGRIYVSQDGEEWQSVGSNARDLLVAGAASDDAVVLAGTEKSMRSADGITWEEIPELADLSFSSAAYGNGRFVLGGEPAAVRTSEDGLTWTLRQQPLSVLSEQEALQNLIFNGEKFVGMTYQDNLIQSSDGLTWTPLNGPSPDEDQTLRGLRKIGARLAIIGGGEQTFFVSDDGLAWERLRVTTETEGSSILDVGYGGGRYLVIDNRSKVYTSEDGLTWTLSEGRISGGGYRIEYAEGQFYILTRSGVYSTVNGLAIARHTLPTDLAADVLVGRPQQLILAGASGQILSSPARSHVGYAAWAEISFAETTSAARRKPEADADGDGDSNFQEYAYGSLPEDPSSYGIKDILEVRWSRGNITRVNYGFFRNEPRYQDGVSYQLEYSIDMETWFDVDLSTEGTAFQQDEETQTHERVWVSGIDGDDARLKDGQGYFRHRVVPLQE